MSQSWGNVWTDRRMDQQTIFYRTLLAETRGPKNGVKNSNFILLHFCLLCLFFPAFCPYCSCKLFWLYRPLQIALACFRWFKHILSCFNSFLTLVSTKTAPQKLSNFSRRDIISDYEFLLSVLMLLLSTLKSITKSITNVYGAKDL